MARVQERQDPHLRWSQAPPRPWRRPGSADYTDTVYPFYSFSILLHSVARSVLGDIYICTTRAPLGGQHGEFGPRGAGSDELKLEAFLKENDTELLDVAGWFG